MRIFDRPFRAPAAFVACVVLGSCGGDSRPPQQLLHEGVATWKSGRIEDAEELLADANERAQESGIDKHTLRMYRGALFALYAAENRHEDAERAYEGVETTTEFMINPVAGHNLGVLRMRAGQNAAAAEILLATLRSLATTEGAADERPLELMTLMHADLALQTAGKRDVAIADKVPAVLDDMLRFQGGRYPYLHRALIRELDSYADRLADAGRAAEAEAIRDRVRAQLARGATPDAAEQECLLLNREWPEGCVLNL